MLAITFNNEMRRRKESFQDVCCLQEGIMVIFIQFCIFLCFLSFPICTHILTGKQNFMVKYSHLTLLLWICSQTTFMATCLVVVELAEMEMATPGAFMNGNVIFSTW